MYILHTRNFFCISNKYNENKNQIYHNHNLLSIVLSEYFKYYTFKLDFKI